VEEPQMECPIISPRLGPVVLHSGFRPGNSHNEAGPGSPPRPCCCAPPPRSGTHSASGGREARAESGCKKASPRAQSLTLAKLLTIACRPLRRLGCPLSLHPHAFPSGFGFAGPGGPRPTSGAPRSPPTLQTQAARFRERGRDTG
jgi:hypothetical protein